MKRVVWIVSLLVLGITFLGCSAEHYKAEADEEVYQIINQKWKQGHGNKVNYKVADVEADPNSLDAENLRITGPLTLADAVAIATAQNREYQSRKEQLYRQALDLTLVRHNFLQQWFGTFDANYDLDPTDDSMDYTAQLGFTQLLADGTQIGVDIAIDWLRYLTGDPQTSLGSVLSATISKPLLRGSGRLVVQENLTQAERNVLYEVRSFNRYRKTFVVSIVNQYYRVLQSLDGVRNAESNYRSLEYAYERAKAFGEAGRMPPLEVDQTEQRKLAAADSLTRAQRQYQQALDEFKVVLALPADSMIELDSDELEALVALGVGEPDYSVEDAVQTALALRLDLATTADELDDAERKVKVAADGLKADLDVSGSMAASSASETQRLAQIEFGNGSYNLGLSADLPFDRKAERNTYRKALLTYLQRQRAYEEAVDEVKLDVRETHRNVIEAANRYKIQLLSLRLAETRVDSTNMLIDAQRATARDLLEAQEALLAAQNARTSTLIDYRIAQLNFYRDVGVLQVRADGLWEYAKYE